MTRPQRALASGCAPLLALLVLAACAKKPPPPDAGGERCEKDADCNRGDGGGVLTCGVLRACVAGRCERADLDGGATGRSWVRPCRDAPSPDGG